MAKLFISHSTEDRQFIEDELKDLLVALGFDIWYAEEDIESSEQWERSILHGLESSGWFVLVMSPRAARSRWVKAEVSWAAENRPDRFIPILLEKCNPLDIHMFLPLMQMIDYRSDQRGARAKLISALVNTEYKPRSLRHIVTGLMDCPSKEILTVVRVGYRGEEQTATIIGANANANRFYGRIANRSIVGTSLGLIFDSIMPQWMSEDDLRRFIEDQRRMMEAIRRGEEIYASVPFKINQKHPNKDFRGGMYLPITIAYSNPEQQGDRRIEDYLVLYLRLDEVLDSIGGNLARE